MSIFCALDFSSLSAAEKCAAQVAPHVGGFKLGMELLYAEGLQVCVTSLARLQKPLFIDLKLHDIPNTCAQAVCALLPLQPAFITLHASGGGAMLRAARDAAETAGMLPRPKLLAVTVLTALDETDLKAVGQEGPIAAQVLRLATMAKENGADGIVCSAHEIVALRAALGPDFILMVPGIRPQGAKLDDQKRVLSPATAMQAGATHLVIGRPITEAEDPAAAAAAMADEMAKAMIAKTGPAILRA